MHRTLALSLAGLLLLGACGDDDDDDAKKDDDTSSESDSDSDDEYVDAIAVKFSDSEDGMSFDEDTSECLAEATVDAIGVQRFKDADVKADDIADAETLADLGVELPSDTTDKLAAAFQDCDAVGPAKDALADSVGGDMTDEDRTCLTDAMADDAIASAISSAIVDGDAVAGQTLFGQAVASCPGVASQLLLSQLGTELTPEAQSCVTGYIEQNSQAVAEAFSSGDTAASEQLGINIATACPDVAAAVGG